MEDLVSKKQARRYHEKEDRARGGRRRGAGATVDAAGYVQFAKRGGLDAPQGGRRRR